MTIDYVAVLEAESAALAAAARLAGLEAPVPSCPEWTMNDLVRHISNVHRRIEAVVRTRADRRISDEELGFLEVGDIAVFEDGAAALAKALRSVEPDEPVWNWSINQPKVAAFWPRRMAQETAVHRWDAQAAASGAESAWPIDAALAVDGIDELVDVFLPAAAAWADEDISLPGSLHLHCTDVKGEWLIRLGDGAVDVVREHAKGDAALRGGASDLLLFGWNRLDSSAPGLEAFGDGAVFAAWKRLTL
jgi:uncharacterized protein (TIGR03083 family)